MFVHNTLVRHSGVKALLAAAITWSCLMTPANAQVGNGKPTASKSREPVLIDAVVVIVNTDVITLSDLNRRISSIEANAKKRKMELPPRDELKKQVLEHMVVERAQLHMAKEAGIRIDDVFLDRAISRIAEQSKLTLSDLRKNVEADGIPYAVFREQIRDEIIMKRLREKEVENKVQVTDSEVDNFLSSAGLAPGQQEINLGHILIRIPENASPDQIAARSKRAQEALQKLNSGADFAKIAATYSDAEDALRGGELGWRSTDRLPQLFGDSVSNLKPGELAPVVKSASGFHILKLLGKRNAGTSAPTGVSVQQTHARHILIKVNQLVSADEAKRKLTELKQRLDNKAAKFEDLAKVHSNDLSASKGGDLGWIFPGDTVPEFERAMNALQPGQISEPVESPFGFHLIEVVARKTDEVSQERQKMAARQAIRERKIEEATQDWLRQVRDSAYVEYRLEEK